MSTDYITKAIEAYNASPDKYVSTARSMPLTSDMQTLVVLPSKTAPLLDAGCANGRDFAWLASKGLKTIGIDRSKELPKRAKQFYPTIEFLNINIRHLNVVGIVRTIGEIYRELIPGGVGYISLKEGQGSREVAETLTSDKPRFWNFKTTGEIIAILERAGFTLKRHYMLNERERFDPDKWGLNWIHYFAVKEA